MEVISDPEVFLDMDVAAEEVVMEDGVGAEVVLQASADDMSRVRSLVSSQSPLTSNADEYCSHMLWFCPFTGFS